MATIEEATKLGLAVQGYLARPPLDPYQDAGTPADALKQKLTTYFAHLERLGVLTEHDSTSLQNYVRTGTLPELPDDPTLLNTGVMLTAFVRFLHDLGSGGLFENPPIALSYVVDATMDGALHAGQDGALTCAAVASAQILRGLKP